MKITQYQSQYYLDLKELADTLDRSIPDFYAKYSLGSLEAAKYRYGHLADFNLECLMVPLHTAHLFILDAPTPKEFNEWFALEVQNAMNKYAVMTKIKEDYNIPLSELEKLVSKDIALEVCKVMDAYVQMGYYPPSRFCNTAAFKCNAMALGYLDDKGEPTDKADVYTRGPHRHAWTLEQGEEIAGYKVPLEPVPEEEGYSPDL